MLGMKARRLPRVRWGALAVVAVVGFAACQEPAGWRDVPIHGFTPVATHQVFSLTSDQGPATVHQPWGSSYVAYTGETILPARTDAGWTHVGDPDSYDGTLVYPYQANNGSQGKMFNFVGPFGESVDYVHQLAPGEEMNNSFATVSPGGQWFVSGEWDTETRLLVFPMPSNPAAPAPGGNLPLASTIELDHPVQYIQGCDFQTATSLICSSDDDAKDLLRVDLSAPVNATSVKGTVTSLGHLPQSSTCTGTFEAEGVDWDDARQLLRVIVVPPAPCFVNSDEYDYSPSS